MTSFYIIYFSARVALILVFNHITHSNNTSHNRHKIARTIASKFPHHIDDCIPLIFRRYKNDKSRWCPCTRKCTSANRGILVLTHFLSIGASSAKIPETVWMYRYIDWRRYCCLFVGDHYPKLRYLCNRLQSCLQTTDFQVSLKINLNSHIFLY